MLSHVLFQVLIPCTVPTLLLTKVAFQCIVAINEVVGAERV